MNFGAVDTATAERWAKQVQKRPIDRCLPPHGGYGYLLEEPVSACLLRHMHPDHHGGTTEILKEIIGRDLAITVAKR